MNEEVEEEGKDDDMRREREQWMRGGKRKYTPHIILPVNINNNDRSSLFILGERIFLEERESSPKILKLYMHSHTRQKSSCLSYFLLSFSQVSRVRLEFCPSI